MPLSSHLPPLGSSAVASSSSSSNNNNTTINNSSSRRRYSSTSTSSAGTSTSNPRVNSLAVRSSSSSPSARTKQHGNTATANAGARTTTAAASTRASGSLRRSHSSPWKTEDDLDILPTRGSQQQTGGRNRALDREEIDHDRDYHIPTYRHPPEATSASSSYARYLQRQDREIAGRPPRRDTVDRMEQLRQSRSRSPSLERVQVAKPPARLSASLSSLRSEDLSSTYRKTYHEEDDDDQFQRNKSTPQLHNYDDDPRSLRAKRLAQQNAQKTFSSTNPKLLQSRNPAVQAYLASKVRDATMVQTPAQSHNDHHQDNIWEQPPRLRSASPTHGGRPPMNHSHSHHHHIPTEVASSVNVNPNTNTTTYTYKFQHTSAQPVPAPAPASAPVPTLRPPRLDVDSSVSRARRLLQGRTESATSTSDDLHNNHANKNIQLERSHSDPPHSSITTNHIKTNNYSGTPPTHPQSPPTTNKSSTVITSHAAKFLSSPISETYSPSARTAMTTTTSFTATTAATNKEDSSVERARRLLKEAKATNKRSNNGGGNTSNATNKHDTSGANDTSPTGSTSSATSTPSTAVTTTDTANKTTAQHLPTRSAISRPISAVNNDSWSVRVCVVSAVDFPVHVVPNMPLCPVLKLGLIPISQHSTKDRVLSDIDRKGLGALAKENMRCTSTKIMSKRDNGAVEYNEEWRWDNVALFDESNISGDSHDSNVALAVELCARGVLRPANLQESPPPHNPAASLSASPLNAPRTKPDVAKPVTPSPSGNSKSQDSLNGSQHQVNTLTGSEPPVGRGKQLMGSLLRQGQRLRAGGRQTSGGASAVEMESANAAAAVAKLLVEGSTSPVTAQEYRPVVIQSEGLPSIPLTPALQRKSAEQDAAASQAVVQNEWNVTLQMTPQSTDKPLETPVMTDDIRLGSLLIPLAELDLQQMLIDPSQPARLEKWFEIQNMNAAVLSPPPAATATGGRLFGGSNRRNPPAHLSNIGPATTRRRNPSILLEISCYAPEVLDESEDEMEEDESDDRRYPNGEPCETGDNIPRRVAISKKVTSYAKRSTRQVRNQLQLSSSNSPSAASPSKQPISPVRDASIKNRNAAVTSESDPTLEPGIIDFIAVVGARDIGNQKDDDGSKGWVNTTPECAVLEQFPPTDDFHVFQNQRTIPPLLPQKVEWFCFPEGVRLWRGTQPPSAKDFEKVAAPPISAADSDGLVTPPMIQHPHYRFTASSIVPSQVALSSPALFDAFLNCNSYFNWFVIASNSEEYGSQTQKTFGAVIRFFVPSPTGIDMTQDDFAQTLLAGSQGPNGEEQQEPQGFSLFGVGANSSSLERKRLWVPIGICVTSSMPIVGAMEAILLRLCEMFSHRPPMENIAKNKINNMIQRHLANLILNFPQPIPGAVNCAVPFLRGSDLLLSVPPKAGLPALPHGNAVASVCRLLGPEGFTFLLAAVLTECKILLHSHNVANLAMVAEVMTALIYPFSWSLPYIPVLPVGMLEFVEAPLSYLLGVSSSCVELLHPSALDDVVVVDLDNGFSSPDWRATTAKYRTPTPLPSLVASNVGRAVYRLLRALEEPNEVIPAPKAFPALFPRLQPESPAEREFRIALALEIGGLVRGYQDCLVFVSTDRPVFNREKFLKRAPALFIEEPTPASSSSFPNKSKPNRRILSSRSKRFLSILVNCQHFHQFLETLRNEECAFFHEVMETWIKTDGPIDGDTNASAFETSSSFDVQRALVHLTKSLRAMEENVPIYTVKQPPVIGATSEDVTVDDDDFPKTLSRDKRFPRNLLQQIAVSHSPSISENMDNSDAVSVASSSQHAGVHHATLSVEYLVELEKNPWRYRGLLDISVQDQGTVIEGMLELPGPITEVVAGDHCVPLLAKVKLREAIGERKFRNWRLSKEKRTDTAAGGNTNTSLDESISEFGTTLDLTNLLTAATLDDTLSDISSQSSMTHSSSVQSSARPTLTAEQQRVANAKDRDVLRRCLERAYSAKMVKDFSDIFTHHGRDLVSEAEVALRNPSAQRFLLSLLSKRSQLDKQQQQQESDNRRDQLRRRASTTSLCSSRLEPIAFECVVRLCCAMLDNCMETKDYEPAYLLLVHSAGIFTVLTPACDNDGRDEPRDYQPMYMTARIGIHPLFADFGLWAKVMALHLAEKSAQIISGGEHVIERQGSQGSLTHAESFDNDINGGDDDEKEYEAAVATLYEMLGYGIPDEELARFATRLSQEYGWFAPGCERGQSLLLLVRRLSVRREASCENASAAAPSDLDALHGRATTNNDGGPLCNTGGRVTGVYAWPIEPDDDDIDIVEIGWCHPAAPSVVGRGSATKNTSASMALSRGGGQTDQTYMNRSSVTALATFGLSVVVSGGLDGSVFLAHTTSKNGTLDDDDYDKYSIAVKGLHLDWGSSGSRAILGSSASTSADGEYGVGAVSCLAAANGTSGHHHELYATSSRKAVLGLLDDEDIIKQLEDSRIIAGTTCGDLRIWSVKDVYASIHAAKSGEDFYGGEAGRHSHVDGASTSSYIPSTPKRRTLSLSDHSSGGSTFNRLKFALRGRGLSGHRGGVTCMDVPIAVYRPDSVVTGGADGLIKLWSLRTPTSTRRVGDHTSFIAAASQTAAGQLGRRLAANRGGDALSVLSGHGGRVLCVRTAWHGDRLLSGGADRTIRIWDLMSGGGAGNSGGSDAACLHTLCGHIGWVTNLQYWGPNTIVSASTDRSLALWDARVRNSPLFVLRHHYAPISDLLVGSRTDPLMVSAASDGTIATWDFRSLSGLASGSRKSHVLVSNDKKAMVKHCKVVRQPVATMALREAAQDQFSKAFSGPTLLCRGDRKLHKTVMSIGADAVMREWSITTGQLMKEWTTGHCDVVCSLTSLAEAASKSAFGLTADTASHARAVVGGTITSSVDGSIRLRKRIPK